MNVLKPILRVLALLSACCIGYSPALIWAQLDKKMLDVPVADNAQLAWVSRNTQVNGHSVSIAEFYSPMSVASTVEFYRVLWPSDSTSEAYASEEPGMIEVADRDWLYLSRLRNGINIVLQLRRDNLSVSTGFLSIMTTDNCLPQDCYGFAQNQNHSQSSSQRQPFRHRGSELLSHIESVDAGSKSSLSVHQSPEHFRAFSRHWLSDRRSEKWTLVLNEKDPFGQIIVMQKKGSRLEMVASQSETGGAIVVVNEVNYENR